MKMPISLLLSKGFIIAILCPLVLFPLILLKWGKISPYEIADLNIFKIYYTIFFLTLSIKGLYLFKARNYGAVMLLAGICTIMIQGAYIYGFHFSGKTAIGIGEGLKGYYEVNSGAWTRLPLIPLQLKDIKSDNKKSCKVLLDKMDLEVHLMETILWKGYKLTLTNIGETTLFILSEKDGKEIEGGYIKLNLDDKEKDYFLFDILPHRFYVSKSKNERNIWKKEGEQWQMVIEQRGDGEYLTDEALHLIIMRGKLTVFEGDLRRGEMATFEDYTIKFERGVPFVEFVVKKDHQLYALYAGAFLFITGLIIIIKSRIDT